MAFPIRDPGTIDLTDYGQRVAPQENREVLDDPVKAFSWTGDNTSVMYHVQCTSSATPGRVLSQATNVVGAKVMTLKSYVFVQSRARDTCVCRSLAASGKQPSPSRGDSMRTQCSRWWCMLS
ncbi:Aste57867_2057 [Aphanomyces stellatus]|uniref:Aste57867_2057 protein n=1 Tax=Aphanomyces stellatus TaxID=120398 RepID=A0A485K797_9STRA|nr:hypothetical protein As57867_002053 [Aphanomyces stellatus]VFT79261.1 Aste57867_2057 [Aphanomyces stellatus]